MKILTILAASTLLLSVPALAQQGAGHDAMAKQDYMKGMQDMH